MTEGESVSLDDVGKLDYAGLLTAIAESHEVGQ